MNKTKYLVLMFAFILVSCKDNKEFTTTKTDTTTAQKVNVPAEKDTISIIGVGDIMMGSTHPSNDLPANDGKDIFKDVEDILTDADLTIGNLEGPFLDKGGIPKTCGGATSGCVAFRMPERYCKYLKDAGFDMMTLANNHAGDMGKIGRETTYKTLDDNEILYAGTLEYPYAIIKRDSLTIGLIGFAPNTGTVSITDLDGAEKRVKELKEKTNIVIVFFHGGGEGAGAQNVTRTTETYLNENRGNVYKFAHTVIDAGADVVLGSGPHVTRAVELYNKKFIAYSLGNFCTYGKFSLYGVQGIAPILKIFINKKGDFIKAEVTSIKQIKRGVPVKDESDAAFKVMEKLTNKDFYETKLKFVNGVILPLD